MIVWDEGDWMPEGDPAAGMKKGHIASNSKGSKLNGALASGAAEAAAAARSATTGC